ncbi:Junctional adhesion molecule C [Clarias magur]|uniref:Junctional adhesion molecule C n=1 Tax=Clarias magur TaxID=1594786 RepID=A0A8J4UIS0_CLAMG|nr:Junctional adhesion molecule C [Clarias magur]
MGWSRERIEPLAPVCRIPDFPGGQSAAVPLHSGGGGFDQRYSPVQESGHEQAERVSPPHALD